MLPRVLFICGSLNQTQQMHKIAQQMPHCEATYSPYYCDGLVEFLRKTGILNFTILGWRRRKECLRYLRANGLPVDHEGKHGPYALVVTCSDVIVPRNITKTNVVAVQEGITDPELFWYWARRFLPFIPRWTSGTAWTGTSNQYDQMCVASEGYRQLFARRGGDASKMVVTGIPNFDNCREYASNTFPHKGFVLVCTSDARETLKLDSRKRFLKKALRIAASRPLVFKLHPNEDWTRAENEIRALAPNALIYTKGCAEEMVANCDVLVCQYSTLAFVGVALGKEVHSYYTQAELDRLLPVQHGRAAEEIARVCKSILEPMPVAVPNQSRLAERSLGVTA